MFKIINSYVRNWIEMHCSIIYESNLDNPLERDLDEIPYIVKPKDYPNSKWIELILVRCGELPKRMELNKYNKEKIEEFNAKYPEYKIDTKIYELPDIVLSSYYPRSRLLEKLYIYWGLLPKRADLMSYNRRLIDEYNLSHPMDKIDVSAYEEKNVVD